MKTDFENRIEIIEKLKDAHLNLGMQMLKAYGRALYPLDIYACGIIKRSLALTAGFITLLREKNYVCAASLLRLQIDNGLRLFAAFIVKDPHNFALEVSSGIPVRKLRDKDGNKMTDRHLINCLAPKYSWLGRVYERTSGFVHFSSTHIISIFSDFREEERSAQVEISEKDDNVPEQLWLELADAYLAASDIVTEYLSGWVFTKDNPDLVAKIRFKLQKEGKWPGS